MSPYYSPKRKTHLLSIEEAMQVFKISENTLKRRLKKVDAYSEILSIRRPDGKGGMRVKMIDPYTLGLSIPAGPLSTLGGPAERATESCEGQSTETTLSTEKKESPRHEGEILRGPQVMALTGGSLNKFRGSVQRPTESSEAHSPAKPTGTLNDPDSLESGEKFRGSLEMALRTKFRGPTEAQALPLSPPHHLEAPLEPAQNLSVTLRQPDVMPLGVTRNLEDLSAVSATGTQRTTGSTTEIYHLELSAESTFQNTLRASSQPPRTTPIILGDLNLARNLHTELLPILRESKGTAARRHQFEVLAQKRDVHDRTVRRWVDAFERGGLAELSRVAGNGPRADKGTHRLPLELVQLVQSTLVSNPPQTSVRMIHRTLLRAVPDIARVRRKNGRLIPISAATVGAIKQEMLDHPTLRLLFADADRRKEYHRTYSGQVLAAHANDMWQMDMTRCDIMIYDPITGKIYRPRVQVVIDVYSGAIMGISFSSREDQEQADLVLVRALMKKQGPLADYYPMFGVARRLYIDNGKTYKSAHFHRIVHAVGMEIIHSRPRVSHTRGKVERFFSTLHGLERSLVGYCGENAKNRSAEELRRLYHKTLLWAEGGREVAKQDRLLTLSEYQEIVLKWLVVEYHEEVHHGLTRAEHFRTTAPARSLVEFNIDELLVIFADWDDKTVRKDGTVSISNVLWTTPDGKLAQHQGRVVQVLKEPFAMGEARRLAAWTDRAGRIQIIGEIVPAPTIAASLEAAAQRRANRAATAEQFSQADALRRQLFNPATTVEASLNAVLPEQVVRPVLPAARARLTVVNPDPQPEPELEPELEQDLGEWGRLFSGEDLPDNWEDMQTYLAKDSHD